MGDKNEEKKKKNPPPAAKSAKRRKKKGPPAAVKIPQGATNSYYLLSVEIKIIFMLSTTHSFPNFEVQIEAVKAGAYQRLFAHGTRVHPKSGTEKAARRAE